MLLYRLPDLRTHGNPLQALWNAAEPLGWAGSGGVWCWSSVTWMGYGTWPVNLDLALKPDFDRSSWKLKVWWKCGLAMVVKQNHVLLCFSILNQSYCTVERCDDSFFRIPNKEKNVELLLTGTDKDVRRTLIWCWTQDVSRHRLKDTTLSRFSWAMPIDTLTPFTTVWHSPFMEDHEEMVTYCKDNNNLQDIVFEPCLGFNLGMPVHVMTESRPFCTGTLKL